MNILSQLKDHKVVEANNLVGLRTGHMVAQAKFDNADELDYLDNGYILELDNKGELVLSSGENAVQYLHYSEEHIKFLDSASLDMFTVYLDKDAYPRAIALYDGDTFTTDNFAGDLEEEGYTAVTIEDGVLTLDGEAGNGPIAKAAYLPSGKAAIQVTWRAGGED